MAARLMFSVVTAIPANVVLIDEILSTGDEHFQGKSFKRLLKMVSNRSSGILATHDWFNATRLCSRIIILNRGEIEFQGTPLEAVRAYLKVNIAMSGKAVFQDKKRLREMRFPYQPGMAFTFSFTIESFVAEPLSLGLAVEIPKLAMVAILSNDNVVGGKKGVYSVNIMFPVFPICYSSCYLSLFLSKPRLPGSAVTDEIYDQISWTTGDSVTLLNSNDQSYASDSIFHRHFKWARITTKRSSGCVSASKI